MSEQKFSKRINKKQIELGTELAPKFNNDGLIPCITVDAESKEVLMFAWMNEEALLMTIETRKATYFSRSRDKIWVKGESSGLIQNVREILVDCDQDVIQLKVRVQGEGTCHQGYRSCFYRAVENEKSLKFVIDERSFDPEEKYGS
ncbi:MAG: phosphoribosyl-AMP cyclohydrolase [Balneolaceae bacterium]